MDQAARTCCGTAMSTLEVFGVRLYHCAHRAGHPLLFENLATGETAAECYRDGDGGLRWATAPPGEE